MAPMNKPITDYTVTNYTVRWNTNNRVPPKDILKSLFDDGLISQHTLDKSLMTLDKETRLSIAEYIASRENMSAEAIAEEQFEMRAAFGPGARITNILTGKVTQL